MSVGRNNKNVRTKQYKRLLARLPENIAGLAREAFKTFLEDPEALILRNHSLDNERKSPHKDGSRAVSVTRPYRAIYVVDGDTNVWYWIGTHENYNIFTGRK